MMNGTTTTALAVPDGSRLAAGSALQQLLPQLAALALEAKQAHWNVTGPLFLPLHAQTDEIATDARRWADRVAERIVALGFSADARPATVAAAAGAFPLGRLGDREVVVELVTTIDGLLVNVRRVLDQVAGNDPVAHDIAVDVLEGLEKQRWMLAAQNS